MSVPRERFAYYDPEVDIAWLPTGPSEEIRGEETGFGLVVRDRTSGKVVALEVWSAGERLPKELLDAMPPPGGQGS
jgi:uncharacterized protein YuzE